MVALVTAGAVFCAAGAGLFYEVADVRHLGWRVSGPSALAGEMAALFGGGLLAVVIFIAALRWRRSHADEDGMR